MKRASWAEVLEGLDAALDLCRDLHLGDHVEGSRFLKYRDHLADLVGALESGGQEAARKVFDSNRLMSMVTLTEATELGDIEPFLKWIDRTVAGDKLVHALGGPLFPSDEGPNTNQPRNLLFELNLAARLWRAGYSPELGEHPDLAVQVADRRLLIQCERPFAWASAQGSFNKAKRQLRRNLAAAPPGSRAVIALSLNRLLHPGDQLMVYSDEGRARRDLADRLETMGEKIRGEKHHGKDVVGMICHVVTAGADESAGLRMVLQQTTVHPFANPGSLDETVFRSMYEALQKNWY